MYRILVVMLCVLLSTVVIGQKLDIQKLTETTLKTHAKKWNLNDADVAEYEITDQVYSKHNKVTHVYVTQKHSGIQIYNAMMTLNFTSEGKLIHAGKRFVSDVASKVNTTQAKVNPETALAGFAVHNNMLVEPSEFTRLKSEKENEVVIQQPSFAKHDVMVRLCYHETKDGELRLAYNMAVYMEDGSRFWNATVDAVTGVLIEQKDNIIRCSFDHAHYLASPDHLECSHDDLGKSVLEGVGQGVDGSQYLVYAPPLESPLYGSQSVVSEPALPAASPFGWHDLDGVEGADTTITRGNNTWAFADYDQDDQADGNEPNGGADLNFNFPHSLNLEPDANLDADIVNVFFMTNFMHDFSYVYGFDEQSGNFQENNYGNGGRGGDPVYAQSLDGFFDPEQRNNANFVPFSDGSVSQMQMYAWEPGESVLTISEPDQIAGQLEVAAATWQNSRVTDVPVVGSIIVVDDNVSVPNDACEIIKNDVTGKVAMIDRGRCEFGTKALNAQNAGAVAVLICNVEGVNGGDGDELVNMGAGADGDEVTIPAIFMMKTDCDQIKALLTNSVETKINIQLPQEFEGARELSSGFDNGIVAHEYAHGISLRLTGGPNNISCLQNDEQMGEGWSDFFTLVTSHRESDTGATPRGIGNYVQRGDITSRGIRTFPYSTDLAVNGKTLNDIRSATSPHALGEVWVTALWDMYWNFIDRYGYDPNFTNPNSGNSRAIQLVMDGMKFQPCRPGFMDGRDAILAADMALFNGEHQCMIWETFARRGVGYFSVQGDSDSRGDNIEDFEPLPTCIKELKIRKNGLGQVVEGEETTVTLDVANHIDDPRTSVTITDHIPEGMEYVDGSIRCDVCTSINARIDGDNLIIELGTMASLDEYTIEYDLLSTGELESTAIFIDDFESDDNLWVEVPLEGNVFWSLNFNDFVSGERSWFVEATESEQDQVLQKPDPLLIEGEKPTMRFKHKFNTEAGFDGGFLEVSADGNQWDLIPSEYFVSNGYNSAIAFGTFAIPALEGFSGNSNGWIETFLDMSAYKGQELFIRFRFGTDEMAIATGDFSGWFVDDFGFVDIASTEGEACVTSAEGDVACDDLSFIFTPSDESSSDWVIFEENNIKVYPNPTDHTLNVQFDAKTVGQGMVRLMSLDGKMVANQLLTTNGGTNYQRIDVSHVPSGVYVLEIVTEDYVVSDKIIKR